MGILKTCFGLHVRQLKTFVSGGLRRQISTKGTIADAEDTHQDLPLLTLRDRQSTIIVLLLQPPVCIRHTAHTTPAQNTTSFDLVLRDATIS